MKDRFIAYDAYKKIAKTYAAIIDTKPHNAQYERPGLLSIMPPVKGKKVLDVGCGTGSLTSWLLGQGAEVIGVDASPDMLKHARNKMDNKVSFALHDITEPMDFFENNSFDLVTASLVFHYVDKMASVFSELNRVLKPGGNLVFSVGHPFINSVKRPSENYYMTEVVSYDWVGFADDPVSVPVYKRPLQRYTEALAEAGFLIERLIEPTPTDIFKQEKPGSYARHMKVPLFLVISARVNKGRP